ncbi:MAG: succinate dehydrogenase, cytochrome b556 subunit, partial [Pseudomonadota bacterium]
MKDKRPVNLDIGTIKLPITAYASISHRVSGVALVVFSFVLLWALDASLASSDSFDALATALSGFVPRLIVWAISVALIYHSLAGVKHLIMDFGVGETMKGGVLGARIV